MDYTNYNSPPPPSRFSGIDSTITNNHRDGGNNSNHQYSSPRSLQHRTTNNNLRSCLRQGNFSSSSNRSTRSAPTTTTTVASLSSYPMQHSRQYQHHHQYHHVQSRGDEDDRSARSAPTTTTGGSVMSNENDERQFMKLSNMLVTQHKQQQQSLSSTTTSSSLSTPNDQEVTTRQLLQYYIPTYYQRQLYYTRLVRNTAVLPMFPESYEHPSYAIIRYVDKVFGPLLLREFGDGVVGGGCGGGDNGMIGSGGGGGGALPSPVSWVPKQQQQQHYQQSMHHHSSSSGGRTPPPPPAPLDYNINNTGPMLFPPPNSDGGGDSVGGGVSSAAGGENEVSTTCDRVPPPIQPSPQHRHHHQQQPQRQQQHVSFPMFSPTESSNPDSQRSTNNNLPRPHHSQATAATATATAVPSSPDQQQQNPQQQHQVPIPRPISTIGDELNKSSHIQQYPTMNSKSLLNDMSSTDDTSTAMNSESQIHEVFTSMSIGTATAVTNATSTKDDDRQTTTGSSNKVVTSTGYQKFTNSNMLPPITPREHILYNLPSRHQNSNGEVSSCCSSSSGNDRAKRKRPTYLQLYVKCERSEPYLQPSESMDIVTWYRNGNNQVTADRTLVVRGTTSLLDLIGGIIESFGLFSDHSDNCMRANEASPLLMAYNDICFMSDVKVSTNENNEISSLTPLPIPGFYYKYVDREVHGRSEMEKESVLSTDPVVLTRTLLAQVLDKPLYQSKKRQYLDDPLGTRSRLALVYCAPKREAYVSSRTQRGVLPETIYHFQILLEGSIHEDDLHSSFQTQTAIRCVGSTGGVAGGSMIDTVHEIRDLNRTLWGKQDVVGLVNATNNPQENLEQIIDLLEVPLFDNIGNQTAKELPLDRCLYHIYSGNLSLSVAKKTQRTVEKMQGTTEWLAKGVEAFAKGITSCVDDDLGYFGGDDGLDQSSMSRLSVSSSIKSQSRTRTSTTTTMRTARRQSKSKQRYHI